MASPHDGHGQRYFKGPFRLVERYLGDWLQDEIEIEIEVKRIAELTRRSS